MQKKHLFKINLIHIEDNSTQYFRLILLSTHIHKNILTVFFETDRINVAIILLQIMSFLIG